MEKQKKNQAKKVISWVLIAAVVTLLAFMPLLAGTEEASDGPEASILSGTVARADISTTLVGGGTLTGEAAVEIEIPAAVKLTEYLVSNGDSVEEGQIIAGVDRVTVMTAITQVQETLEYLAEEIQAVIDEEEATSVTAQAGGTVKIIYAEKGDNVQDVMLRNGALAVLSLDGLLAVQVERDTNLSGGDTVCVAFADGTEVDGRVESNLQGVLTVTVEDDGYAVGEKVTVYSGDGNRLGSGALYIHSQWNAVAYTGTVSSVRVSEGNTVNAGRTLFTLTDTGHTAEYQVLVNQHQKYEELMLTLFQMYQSETITAPCGGVVTGVDQNGAYMLSDDGTGWKVTLLANAPNGDDETTYVNYIGQVTSVGIDGLVLRMNPQSLHITDYRDLSGVPTDPAAMTQDVIYTAGAPVYELSGGEWVQISAADITAGDTLLFAGDASGNFVWVVRVAKAAVTPDEPDATDPTDPTEPDTSITPTEPDASTDSTTPADSNQQGAGTSQGGGSFSGFGGGTAQQEEEYQLYGMDMVTVASVTPQEEMTVEITIDELDISKLYLGQEASVTLDALAGERFEAVITRIGNTGESDGGNSKFTVELTLAKSGDMLPGMSACVVVTLGTVSDCVTVPVAALCESGTQTTVYTSFNEETGILGDPVPVTVGISDGEHAQILSGLEEGAAYYYAYYDTLEVSNVPEKGGTGFRFGR